MGPCLPHHRISTTCTISMLRNYRNAILYSCVVNSGRGLKVRFFFWGGGLSVFCMLYHLKNLLMRSCGITIIGSDNGLSPGWRAIIWTNAGILLIGPLGTKFNKILIKIQTFSFKKIHFKMSSMKWRPFCLGLNVLTHCPLGDLAVSSKI